MTKKTRSSKSNGRQKDPNQDVQPWLGWVAALLVVVIVVVAVAMGMARTNSQRGGTPEVRMTPLVGGIEVPVATETAAAVAAAEASEVTPLPEDNAAAITTSEPISVVTVITTTAITTTAAMTDTDMLTMSGEMTPSAEISATAGVTTTEPVSSTEAVTATREVTTSATAEATIEATVEITVEATVEATSTVEAELEATPEESIKATATPRPTATTRPTATPMIDPQVFEVGESVAASAGRVEIHAEATMDALTLDTVSPGVPLEVMLPNGDFADYPVIADGHGWVRVRAADGLVGWVMTDQVEAQ